MLKKGKSGRMHRECTVAVKCELGVHDGVIVIVQGGMRGSGWPELIPPHGSALCRSG
jgi:hypothetical protein